MKRTVLVFSVLFLVFAIFAIPHEGALTTNSKEEKGVAGVIEEVLREGVKKVSKKVIDLAAIPRSSSNEMLPQPINNIEQPMAETKQWRLLENEIQISNESHVFVVTDDMLSGFDGEKLFLSFTYKMDTQETASAFDDPAFVIEVGDTPVYMMASQQFDWITRTFILDQVVSPTTISIWSGNSGDDVQPTTAFIKDLFLYKKSVDTIDSDIAEITDVFVSHDTAEFVSVDWSAPQSFVSQLERVLRYDFRISEVPIDKNISDEQWLALSKISPILPVERAFLSQLPKNIEQRLFKVVSSHQHMAIRGVDWQGKFGPIHTFSIPQGF
jgi:hypothetical protein